MTENQQIRITGEISKNEVNMVNSEYFNRVEKNEALPEAVCSIIYSKKIKKSQEKQAENATNSKCNLLC